MSRYHGADKVWTVPAHEVMVGDLMGLLDYKDLSYSWEPVQEKNTIGLSTRIRLDRGHVVTYQNCDVVRVKRQTQEARHG